MKQQAIAKQQANANKFWDGFQWVDKSAFVPTGPVAASAPPQTIANTKDRRIYIGNLPPGISAEYLREFGEY